MNLQELKMNENDMRETLLSYQQEQQLSILQLSKMMGIPYSTVRSFLFGASVGFVNLHKIHTWINNQITERSCK